MRQSTKTTRTIAWVLVIPISLFLFMAGGTKVAGMNPLASIESMSPWVFWIGSGELTAAILFAIPRTSIIGALALSAHLGGAILFHIIRGEQFIGPILTSFWFQSTLLSCVWAVVVLRYPAILDNFEGSD
ncbi:MAG: DoxX family protein [Gammaproteobacteria bacterium]